MRRGNNTGGVVDLGKKRRNRYAARVTVGYKDNGSQIYKYIGFYSKRSDAVQALAEYYADPYDIDGANMTFGQIWDAASKYFEIETKSSSTIASYRSAFKNCKELHSMKMKEIRANTLQRVIDNANVRSRASLNNMLIIFHYVFEYSMQNDYVKKDYSKYVRIRNTTAVKVREIFTFSDIEKLWATSDDPNTKITLILLYTGFRINELFDLTPNNIDINSRIIIGGSKTAAGKNRRVPIHHRIVPLIKYFLDNGSAKSLFQTTYPKYNKWLKETWNHKAHDTRHTFTSLLQQYDAKKVWIDKIIGHASGNLTDDLYTHADDKALLDTIELLP